MASKVVGNLIVNLAANIASFESSMRKANKTSQRQMRSMERRARETQKKMQNFGRAVAGAFAIIGGAQAVRGIIRASAEVERMQAALVTVTGSTEAATAEFAKLEAFAAKTPFQLQEVVNGFIKLKARGLDPSIASMTAYGNVAGATGKTLDQFIEAVGDAATGEMERLKEFGIVARQQGESVKFTFQGVTTEVGRNSEEITGYLRSLGEVQFAGGMERQANTIGGAISNLQDATFKLMSSGNTESLKTAIRELSDTLSDPEVAAGIQNLITGLITLTSWLTKAAAKFAGFGKVVGEFFGSMAVGPTGKVFENAREIREEIEKLNKDLEAAIQRQTAAGATIDVNNMPSHIEELLRQKKILQDLYEMMLNQPPPVKVVEGGEEETEKAEEIELKRIKYDSLASTLGLVEQRQEALNALNNEARELTASVMTAQEHYNAEMQLYQAHLDSARISQETFNRLQQEAKKRLEDSADGFDIMKAAGEEAGRAIQSAFADFFMNMDDGVKGMAKNFIDAMRRMLSEALALQALQGLFPKGSGAANFLGLYAGHGAIGGLQSGPTIVGEHGPEMVNLPSGTNVTPTTKMGGGLTVNVDARWATSPVEVLRQANEGTARALREYHIHTRRGLV